MRPVSIAIATLIVTFGATGSVIGCAQILGADFDHPAASDGGAGNTDGSVNADGNGGSCAACDGSSSTNSDGGTKPGTDGGGGGTNTCGAIPPMDRTCLDQSKTACPFDGDGGQCSPFKADCDEGKSTNVDCSRNSDCPDMRPCCAYFQTQDASRCSITYDLATFTNISCDPDQFCESGMQVCETDSDCEAPAHCVAIATTAGVPLGGVCTGS